MEDFIQFLNRKAEEYNTADFIRTDPISIPHLFTRQQDIEIAGFFASIFAWGNRTLIINKCKELLQRMDYAPYDFVRHHGPRELQGLLGFKHRTFNETDLLYFVEFFHHHYAQHQSLEEAFTRGLDAGDDTVAGALNGFYRYFFSLPDAPARTRKHIAAPEKGSTCKRLNMYLRWMVRADNCGVDFGLWKRISPAQLVCPIDVHVARVARRFNLLQRTPTDWQAALELTRNLKKFDPADPVKYDFALFGLGVVEKY
ncbi:TIGR02757 family protein [Paraflavisolibacter sp. H34]|uniref:TIGR02757 family protein n=1 Tax=Huijunlia imazamoxiresistens TaxID=3127457 RepID=UPI003015DA43